MSTTIPARRRPPVRRRVSRVGLTGLALAITLAVMAPVAWLLASAFRTDAETASSSSTISWRTIWPEDWTLDNFTRAFESGFGHHLMNSIVVTTAELLGALFIASIAAFVFAVIPFPGRTVTFAIVVLSFLVPFEAIAIPLSRMFADVGLTNTYPGLFLPGLGSGLAVFVLRQFFLGIPGSLAEAAKIDGAGWWRIYWSIYLPLSRPALIGAGLLIFLGSWSAYLWPILVATDSDLDLAPVAIAKSFTAYTSDQASVFAQTLILAAVPAVILLALQRFFVVATSISGTKE